MKKICAWCKKELGTVPSAKHDENTITHGACEECRNRILSGIGKELYAFLDRLEAPVLIIDGAASVRNANKQAREILQRDLPDIKGYRGGEVFECAYSKLPEGCGNTIHCSGCTIRRAVMETHHTGKNHLKTPAYLNRGDPENYKRINLLISTERVDAVVLLRIDKVEFEKNVERTPL